MNKQIEALKLALHVMRNQGDIGVDEWIAASQAILEALAEQPAQQAPDYAWPAVQDYEADVGFKVNDAFQMGWDMARTTNDLFKQTGSDT